MNWARAIERNSEALKAIVAALFVMLGSIAAGARIPRIIHRDVLRVLRPAEAAMRRLIVIAARGLVARPAAPRPKPSAPIRRGNVERRHQAFRLFDPRKRFAPFGRKPGRRVEPRVWYPGHDPTVPALLAYQRSLAPKPPDDGLIDGTRLSLRLEALKRALDDVPRQARRLVRARARRARIERLELQSVMRPGRPPGYRRKPIHAVDHVLAECHALAREVEAHDTS